jgi:hypothetical protein
MASTTRLFHAGPGLAGSGMRISALATSLLVLSGANLAAAAAPPEHQCLAARFKAAGIYARCQTATKAVEETKGTTIAFLKAALRCQRQYAAKWVQLRRQFPGTSCAQDRYLDNGDGTVTDTHTGLQWERKKKLDGTTNASSPRDADNQYTWSASGSAADGTAYTDFLATLNGGCFAGHCDWRLPTFTELQTLVDPNQGVCAGGSGACIDPVFGPTSPEFYWTSSSRIESNLTTSAMLVDFGSLIDLGKIGSLAKFRALGVRAVRGGLQ